MWRSSSKPADAGFTLMEVLVVLASLGMILWMAAQLLFPMRQAAERQRLQVEARQTARGATDYVAMLVRGATDMNDLGNPRNPAAILTFVLLGSFNPSVTTYPTCDGSASTNCVQLSYNNVTDPTLAAPGTDIMTFGVPAAPSRLKVAVWPSNGQDSSSPSGWEFDLGCPSDPGNKTAFDEATGRDASGNSMPLMLFDATGQWVFYQITDYKDTQNTSTCSSPSAAWCTDPDSFQVVPCMQVVANPGNAALNAPGGHRDLTNPVSLIVGLHYAALRVCNGWLEQKFGMFDPTSDNNCPALAAGAPFPPYTTKTAWSPLLPNVEDLQFAYLFDSGVAANGPGGTMGTPAGVPIMGPQSPLDPNDIRRVIGVRVTITARATTPVLLGGKTPMPPPPAEDHDPAGAADTYFRFQLSSTCLLRNRLSGI